MNILAVIPARGGSKGIPRKNVRLLHGQPLVSYAIQNAISSKYNMDVCVSTDDIEVERIAKKYNAFVINREAHLATDSITLDPVIYDAYLKMKYAQQKEYDLIITLQATSPLLKIDSLDGAIDQMVENNSIDTMLSAVNNPHLSWATNKNGEMVPDYEERLNRQYLPLHFMETGAFLITKKNTISENNRIGKKVAVYEVNNTEAVDIDTPHDWWIAENELAKKNILIRVEGYKQIGLGHIYRGLTLAYSLIHHNVHFVISNKSDIGIKKLKESHFPYTIITNNNEMSKIIKDNKTDIIINDILNTDIEYISFLRKHNIKIMNFEDLGDGANLADIVINDLYAPLKSGSNYKWGSDYYILREEFLISEPSDYKEKAKNLLFIFGGVDPSGLTEKLFKAIPFINRAAELNFTIVVGPGYTHLEKLKDEIKKSPFNIKIFHNVKNMSDIMRKSDIAVSSQGRTMLELASMRVPTVLMAQNKRELTHEFGDLTNGFINLGLGSELSIESIAGTLNWLIDASQVRKQMYQQMSLKDLTGGLQRVLNLIFA